MRGWILLALLLWLPSGCSQAQTGPEPPTVPPDLAPCGLGDATIPNFALVDDNSNSPTHGQTVALNDFSGKVVVIYWMTAT